MSDRSATCAHCGVALTPGARFCETCGQAVPVSAGAGLPVVRAPGETPVVRDYQGSDPLLSFDVEYPERLSRLLIFVKWLVAIPHFVILYFLGIAVAAVWFIAFFAVLILGRYPRGLWDFMMLYLRWTGNVYSYLSLQRDEYPPFGDTPYPVQMHLTYPETLSRWKVLVKWLLIIPHLIVWSLVAFAAFIALVIAWFAILITGSYPKGLFDFVTGTYRWWYRISAYSYFLTDRYPPFSLS